MDTTLIIIQELELWSTSVGAILYEEIEEIITMQNVCGSRGEKMFVALKCYYKPHNHGHTHVHIK